MSRRARRTGALVAAAAMAAFAAAGCGSSDSDSKASSSGTSTAAASSGPVEASIMLEFPANASQIYWFSALERGNAVMQVLTGNDRFVAESYKLGANGALIGSS